MVTCHRGTVGNYIANQLARIGLELTCGISTGALGRDETLQCIVGNKHANGYRQEPSTKRTTEHLEENRNQLRWARGLFTWYCHLKEHLYKFGLVNNRTCGSKLNEVDTASNILRDCEIPTKTIHRKFWCNRLFESPKWDSSFAIETSYKLDGWGSISGRGKRFCSVAQLPERCFGPPSLLSSGYRGFFLQRESSWGVQLTTYLNLVPWSSITNHYL
jgi:hypothetical protein